MTLAKIFPELDQFDLLFKNFFDRDTFFSPISQSKTYYPVNISETNGEIQIEIAVCGLNKEDIKIDVEDNNILRVSYEKPEIKEDENTNWLVRSITRKSFNFGWKISNKFDLSTIQAKMDKGLLSIQIKKAKLEEFKPKMIEIQ